MTLFVTADLHFGHAGILKHTDRARQWRVSSVAEHDDHLIRKWNSRVAPKDEVWVLGDFALTTPDRATKIFGCLNGRKRLIVGNHDNEHVRRLPWESVDQIRMLRHNGLRAVCCHYPMLTWDRAHHGVPHLHGHSHGNLATFMRSSRLDVGVDNTLGFPISVDVAVKLATSYGYVPVDHHTKEK